MKKITIIILALCSYISYGQVGIGTTAPQQELHIAGANSTIRIESLDATNEPTYNDGVKPAPAYVDGNGDITLTPTSGSGGEPLNFLIDIPNFLPDNPDGLPFDAGTVINNNDTGETTVTAQIGTPISITVPQTAIIEVKYGITLLITDVDMTLPALSYLTDDEARAMETYFVVDINSDGLDATELSKQYGQKGQYYASNWGGAIGYPYMNGQGYLTLPAGTHEIVFYGVVHDAATSYTSVGFGGDKDFLKIRVYN